MTGEDGLGEDARAEEMLPGSVELALPVFLGSGTRQGLGLLKRLVVVTDAGAQVRTRPQSPASQMAASW